MKTTFQLLLKLLKSKKVQISFGIICTLLILVISTFDVPVLSPIVQRADALVYDHMLNLGLRKHQERARVVIVDIDDQSLFSEGRWPWPRDKMAALLSKLQGAGVVVAGFDIVMSDPEINYALGLINKLNVVNLSDDEKQLPLLLEKIANQVDNDNALATAIKSFDVALGFLFHNMSDMKKGTLPLALTDDKGGVINANEFYFQNFQGYNASLNLLRDASGGHGGFVTNLPDKDGVVRQGLLLASYDNKVYPSLALMIAMRYLLADGVNLKISNQHGRHLLSGIDIAGTFIPTNFKGQILIPYWGQPFTMPYYSATDILHDKFDKKELEGAVAIIGSSTVLLADLHPAPVASIFPGVEMVANMVSALIGEQVTSKYDWQTSKGVALVCFFGILFAFVFPFLGITYMLITTALAMLAMVVGVIVLYMLKNLYIPSGYLLVLVGLQTLVNYSYDFFLEKRQKHKIKALFGQYVPETYVKELMDANQSPSMEGETRDMTVFFSDIRSFTNTSEGLDASGVKKLLNTFFTPITEIIFKHHGTIDKYVGDMVMAFWGAPVPIPNNAHAHEAIATALEIFKELPKINIRMKENNLPTVNIGIGLGTGLMNVGDMGSSFRKAYTVLGDVVNLASRLESLTKFYGVNILVNDATREGQDKFIWRAVDKVTVKGRKSSLIIYQPIGFVTETSADVLAEIEEYHQALNFYYAQDWLQSERLFSVLHTRQPMVKLYKLYLERIETYKNTVLPADWDGVFTHTEK